MVEFIISFILIVSILFGNWIIINKAFEKREKEVDGLLPSKQKLKAYEDQSDKDVIISKTISELYSKAFDILEERGLTSCTAQLEYLYNTSNNNPIKELTTGKYDSQIKQFIDICYKVGLKPEIKYSIIDKHKENIS